MLSHSKCLSLIFQRVQHKSHGNPNGKWDCSVPNEAIKQIPSVPFKALVTQCPYVHCFIEADDAGYFQTNTCAYTQRPGWRSMVKKKEDNQEFCLCHLVKCPHSRKMSHCPEWSPVLNSWTAVQFCLGGREGSTSHRYLKPTATALFHFCIQEAQELQMLGLQILQPAIRTAVVFSN